MSMFRKALGKTGEDLACTYLNQLGYTVIEKNYSRRNGEIDIIARHNGDLVFIEVKTRSSTSFGSPLDAVGPSKQRQIITVAQHYIAEHKLFDDNIRFDVVGIILESNHSPQFDLITNAFELW